MSRLLPFPLILLLALPSAWADGEDADKTRDAQREALTTEAWSEPPVPVDLIWHLLAFPERVVEVVFTPLHGLLALTERYRLDRRLKDALRNDSGTIVVSPKVKLSLGDGFGGGASLKLSRFGGAQTSRLDFSALARRDGDSEIGARYRYAFAHLEGRALSLEVERELDGNVRFYGIGDDTSNTDKRAVSSERIEAQATLDLSRRGSVGLTGKVTVGYRHELLGPGSDPTAPPADPNDMVGVPVGFDSTLDFASIKLAGIVDTRDTIGRPTRGIVGELDVTLASAVDDAELNAVAARAQVQGHYSPLPGNRVFVLTLGFAAATPVTSVGAVPFHLLPTLGRVTYLRGFRRGRFRDKTAYWTSLEYRYPIYEYKTSRVALEPKFFLDVGRVGSGIEDLLNAGPRWAYGGGFRIAHETKVALDLTLGFSQEGLAFNFLIGKGI